MEQKSLAGLELPYKPRSLSYHAAVQPDGHPAETSPGGEATHSPKGPFLTASNKQSLTGDAGTPLHCSAEEPTQRKAHNDSF